MTGNFLSKLKKEANNRLKIKNKSRKSKFSFNLYALQK